MFCKKTHYLLIEIAQKRALRVSLTDSSLSYNDLLKESGYLSIHTRHIQILMVEIFKTSKSAGPAFMKDLFQDKSRNYNLRYTKLKLLPSTKTKTYGTNAIIFKGCLLWNKLPEIYKSSKSINEFKQQIMKFNTAKCTCKICV